jgi:hypothetical protein
MSRGGESPRPGRRRRAAAPRGPLAWKGAACSVRMPGLPVHVADVCCHVHCPGHRRDSNGGGDRPPEARCNQREPDEHPGTGRACTVCASQFAPAPAPVSGRRRGRRLFSSRWRGGGDTDAKRVAQVPAQPATRAERSRPGERQHPAPPACASPPREVGAGHQRGCRRVRRGVDEA